MPNNPLISIIIPTYNVESYIGRCLDSCINQTLGDIEIIVVDDCGSDNSIKIAKEYVKKDSRIRIIHNESNLGLFSARIQGERVAKGAYILPLDADDYISIFTCKILYRTLCHLYTTPLYIPRLFKNLLLSNGGGDMIKNNPLISIVVPVYNVRAYLSRCLESCINQSLNDIEILVIDDCGSDDSIKIAQKYVQKDSRIRIIHNEKNLGTFAARIKGMQEANGLYITFLDADDYLDIKACEKSYQAVLESVKKQDSKNVQNLNLKDLHSQDPHNQTIDFPTHIALQSLQTPLQENLESLPDIVFFGMRFEPRTFKRVSPPVITKTLYNEEVLSEVFAHCATPPWHICAKLYKASHIVRVSDLIVAHMGENPRLTMAEDVLKSFWICALAHKSIGIKDKLYTYCESSSSITRKIDSRTRDKKIADISRVIDELESLSHITQLTTNKAFNLCQKRAIDILKSVRELEHRYDSFLENEGGARYLISYLKACVRSLLYHRKWQTYVRMLLATLTLGKIKL